ncbi:MAG TPA: hypothetical protein VIL36_11680 [Acidimicrobiales bacterium]
MSGAPAVAVTVAGAPAGATDRWAWVRPWHVGVVGGVLALGIVLGRLLVPADGDISRFVVAGDNFADPATVDPPIHVYEDSWGYDGQFFWRLAVDPFEWDLDRPQHGLVFDSAYRPPRLGYPLLAWALAGGHGPWVATTLVAVNVLACGAVAWLGAVIARRAGRSAAAGLLVASTPGLVFALARDLSDAVALAFVLAGVVAVQRGRWGWATLAWAGAVATREQALVVVAGYGLWRVVDLVRSGAGPRPRRRPWRRLGAADLPWLVPPGIVVALQALVWARTGELPVAAAQESNFTFPFGALGPALGDWLRGDVPAWDDMVPFQFALAVALVVLAFRWGRTGAGAGLAPADRWLLVSLGLVTVMAVSFGERVWQGASDLRQVLDVLALSWVVVLSTPRRLPPWVLAATTVVWLGTAAYRTYAI